LEFCTNEDKRAWDVGFFLCFLALRVRLIDKKEISKIFLETYQKQRRLNMQEITHIMDELKEYFPIFETILDIRQFTPEELFAEMFNSGLND
jgi:aminoglycoside phosphotransferase family enzyme